MSIAAAQADAFFREVQLRGEVWSICDELGFPTSTNASGETSMPFWSSEKRAMSIIKSVTAYCDFTPEPIPLATFVKRWLPGLQKDGLYCGLNWAGARATGYDLSAADLMARLEAAQEKS